MLQENQDSLGLLVQLDHPDLQGHEEKVVLLDQLELVVPQVHLAGTSIAIRAPQVKRTSCKGQ